MNKPPPAPERRRWPFPAALLLALAVVAWLQRSDGRLHVALLETGGDAALIRTPTGRFVLVDGGRDPTQLAMQLGRELPFWRRDLLAVVLTAPGGRRLPGQVAALARYRPATALAPPGLGAGGTAGEWRRLVTAHEARTRVLRAGQRIDLDGATLTVLAAESGDEGGAVLLLTYGATRVLFHTGGGAGDAAALRVAGRPVDLLLYPWQRPLDTSLIAALRPRAIAFTAAYEAPDPALLSYADRRRHSPQLYHTENDGTVELVSDGRRVTITTDKP